MPALRLLLLAVLLGFHLPAMSVPQPACSDPSLTITLKGQAQVDAWSTAYDCTVVQGSLFIYDATTDPVTSLAGLTSLQQVQGRVFLGASDLTQLTTLQGLNNLTSVGSLRIDSAPELTDISALSNLTAITCPINSLTRGGCESALTLAELPKLTSVAALSGLSGKTTLSSLSLRAMPMLANVAELNNFPQAQRVIIEDLPLATPGDIAVLNHLAAAAEFLQLSTLPGVSSLPVAPQLDRLTLANSPFADLTDIGTYPRLRQLSLRSLPLITDAALAPIANLPLSIQDNFNLGLSEMNGLVDLSGLAGLSRLGGTLLLTNNASLTSLAGLSSLARAENLTVNNNPLLTSLSGLDALRTIGGNLNVEKNAMLQSLTGLDLLVGGVEKLQIFENPVLSNVRSLRGITSANTFLAVVDNPSLNECDVFAPIAAATGPAKSYFVGNGAGTSCDDTRDIQNYVHATLTVTPAAHDYGSVNQGSSASQAFTIASTGSPSTLVQLGIIRVEDSNTPAWFVLDGSTTCTTGQVLNSGQSCTVVVNSAPLGFGPDQADIRVPFIPVPAYQPFPPPTFVALQVLGDGVPSANLTPSTSLDFGTVTVGDTSAPQTVTVTNSGTAPLTINSITDDDPADFPLTNNCGGVLAIGATCDITVNFTPTRRGTLSGTLSLNSSAALSPQKLVLTGIGAAPPALTVSPTDLTFPPLATGTSLTLPLVITNTGDDDLVIAQGTFSNPDYSFSSDACSGQTLLAGQACQTVVRLSASSVGAIAGSLSIASNDPASPTLVPLSGTGEQPAVVSATPANLSFGQVDLGDFSDLPVTVSNTGGPSTTVTINSLAINAPDYSLISDTCTGQSLAGGSTCNATVRFQPTTSGPDNGTLEINHSLASSSPLTVGLVGTGGTPVAYINPSSIDFGNVLVGNPSAPTVVTVGDSSASDLTIGTVVASGPEFLISNDNCSGQTITSGGTCTFEVVALPTTAGGVSGTVSVASDSPSSPDKVSLLANGATAATVQVSSTSFTFNGVDVGGTGTQSLTINNAGGFDLVLGALSVTGSSEFSPSSDACSNQTLAPGATCTVSIDYARGSTSAATGALSIPSNSPSSPDQVSLSAPDISTPSPPRPVPVMSAPLLVLLSLAMIVIARLRLHRR